MEVWKRSTQPEPGSDLEDWTDEVGGRELTETICHSVYCHPALNSDKLQIHSLYFLVSE